MPIVSTAKKRTVLERDENRCVWCGLAPLILIADIPPDSRVRIGTLRVDWYDWQDFKQSGYIATVDHIIEQAQGGPSSLYNLVASCTRCNQWRSSLSEDHRLLFEERTGMSVEEATARALCYVYDVSGPYVDDSVEPGQIADSYRLMLHF
jgi:hypothetical protein